MHAQHSMLVASSLYTFVTTANYFTHTAHDNDMQMGSVFLMKGLDQAFSIRPSLQAHAQPSRNHDHVVILDVGGHCYLPENCSDMILVESSPYFV